MTAERWIGDRFLRYFAWFPLIVVAFAVALSSSRLARFEIALIAACVVVTYVGYETDSFRRARKFEDLQTGFQDFREYAGARLIRNGNLLENTYRGTKAILAGQTQGSICGPLGFLKECRLGEGATTTGRFTTREEDSEAARGSYPHDLERRWENAVRTYHRNKLGPNDVEVGNQTDSYPRTTSGLVGYQTNSYSGLGSGYGAFPVAQSAGQVGNDQALGYYSNQNAASMQSVPNYAGTATKLETYDEVGPTSIRPFQEG